MISPDSIDKLAVAVAKRRPARTVVTSIVHAPAGAGRR